jgi:hypothetical protein
VESPAVKTWPKGARTYTVASKLQTGLTAHIFAPFEERHPVLGHGVQAVTVWRRKPGSPEVIINGSAQSRDHGARLKDLVAGHAITKGVDAEFWDTFVEQHKDADYIQNRLLIWWPENDDGESISDYAKDGEKLLSGYEPLDLPLNDPNAPIPDPRVRREIGRNANIQVGGSKGGGDVGNV